MVHQNHNRNSREGLLLGRILYTTLKSTVILTKVNFFFSFNPIQLQSTSVHQISSYQGTNIYCREFTQYSSLLMLSNGAEFVAKFMSMYRKNSKNRQFLQSTWSERNTNRASKFGMSCLFIVMIIYAYCSTIKNQTIQERVHRQSLCCY